jgi:hypothetical protein
MYWPIGAWSKSKSFYVNFEGLVALGLEGLWCATWGALALMIVCGHTFGFNVMSIMSSTIILGGLMNGSTCLSKVFINVFYASSSEMMFQINGVFKLLGGNICMEPINCMGMYSMKGALDTWTWSSSIGMFGFALPLLDPWTCQTMKSNNNLENEML